MSGTDAIVERILTTYDTITVVGASAAAAKAAHSVPARMQGHGWRIIPVNPHADEILGEPVFRTLGNVPEQVGLVDVFRPPWQAPDIARQAVAAGATALWLQLGIASAEARAIAEGAGLLYVEDRCLIIEQRRLGLEAPPADERPRPSVTVGGQPASRSGARTASSSRPSSLHLRDAKAIVPGLGGLTLDVAFGGNVYAILPAVPAGLAVRADLHDRSRPRITGWAGNGPAHTR